MKRSSASGTVVAERCARALASALLAVAMAGCETQKIAYAGGGGPAPGGEGADLNPVEHATLVVEDQGKTRVFGLQKYSGTNWHGVAAWSLKDRKSANLFARCESLDQRGREEMERFLEKLPDILRRDPAPSPPEVEEPAEKAPPEPKTVQNAEAADGTLISWKDADNCIGEKRTVEGVIDSTHRSEAVCILYFDPDRDKHFFAAIHAPSFSAFPPNPESYYKGKTVRITGVIGSFRGRPRIILEDPKQIEVLP